MKTTLDLPLSATIKAEYLKPMMYNKPKQVLKSYKEPKNNSLIHLIQTLTEDVEF